LKAENEELTHAPKVGKEFAICDEGIAIPREGLNFKPTTDYTPTCAKCARGVEAMQKFLEG
jgi:hypothetical protein